MNARIRVVATPALAAGFRLAGLRTDEALLPRDAEPCIAAAASDPTIGILLVEHALLEVLPDAMRRELERRPVPILVPIPGAEWERDPTGAERYILDVLQRAIGYRVRLQ